MILLIGGSSRVGKSLLAHKMQHLLSCRIIHLDSFKSDFSEKDDIKLRPMIFEKAAKVIKDAVKSGENLIVEGCYIPENYKSFFSEYELASIRSIFIVMSENYIREHFDDIIRYEGIIEERKGSIPDIERLISCSKAFKQDCKENNSFCYEIQDHYSINELIVLTKEQIM